MPNHRVEEGERLVDIALANDFENVETIWNAPENAALRKERAGPSQVRAGDSVFIPEKRVASFEKPGRGVQGFQVHVAKLNVQLRLFDSLGNLRENTACTLKADGQERSLSTDGDGIVHLTLKRDAREATLVVGNDTYRLAVGELAALPEPSGVEGRLLNLGYLDGNLEGVDGAEQLAAALEQFQSDHGLSPDGQLSDETVAALREAHGS